MKNGFINIIIYLFLPGIITSLFHPYVEINNITYFLFVSIPYLFLLFYFINKYKIIFKDDLKKINIKNILITILLCSIGFGLMLLSNYIINYIVFDNGIANNEAANRNLLNSHSITYSFLMCLIIPILEEISFRLEFKKNMKPILFILLSSFVFGLVHLVNISSFMEMLYLIPYTLIGLGFSITYYKTDCIYMNILSHVIHNTICVIYILFIL